MTKACNARFGKIVKNYAEINAMKGKGKLAFCASLMKPLNDSSSIASKSLEVDSAATAKLSDATTMSSYHPSPQTTTDEPKIPATTAVSNFTFPSPGINGVMHKKFLEEKVLILVQLFVEVNTDAAAARSAVTSMFESLGGKMNGRF